MNVNKAREWLQMYINIADGEFRRCIHTGDGIIYVPIDIYTSLSSAGLIIQSGEKTLFHFDGDFGRSVIQVVPFSSEKRRNSIAMRVVNLERQKKNIVVYANKMKLSDAQTFNELPEEIKRELLALPYSAIVRPLIIADMKNGEVNYSKMAVKYGVEYQTVYKWFNR